jgi:PTS system nitrogen regulatory IIA component
MTSHLLSPEGVMSSLKAKSKSQALQKLSHSAAQLTGLPAREIFDKLQQRERLGSTGFGRGAAIPHVESGSLKSLFAYSRVSTNPSSSMRLMASLWI